MQRPVPLPCSAPAPRLSESPPKDTHAWNSIDKDSPPTPIISAIVWEILLGSEPEKGRGQPHPADPTLQEWIYASLLVAVIETTGKHESEGTKQDSLPTEVARATLGGQGPGFLDWSLRTSWNSRPWHLARPANTDKPWAILEFLLTTASIHLTLSPPSWVYFCSSTPYAGKSGRLTFLPEVLTLWNVLPSSSY